MRKYIVVTICLLCLILPVGCKPREIPADTPSLSREETEPEKAPVFPAQESSNPVVPVDKPLEIEPEPSVAQDVSDPAPEPPSESEPQVLPEAYGPAVAVSVPGEALLETITGVSWQEDGPLPVEDLRLVTVRFVDFEGQTRTGELLAHHELAGELAEIFEELYAAGFPMERVSLIDEYGADDLKSMEANNTSCFCTRMIAGTERYSSHSYGAGVDINPVQNPYVRQDVVEPEEAAGYLDRSDVRPGMIVEGGFCHTAFTLRGWVWGGAWENPDYQHFEKAVG